MAAMTVAQIVESESDNKNRIHLYREGLFLKAYDRSAFLFQKHVKSFRPVKKSYKSVGGEVVMLGFPSGNLSALLPSAEFLERDEMHVCFACPEIDLREYGLWFDAVRPAPEKPRRNPVAVVADPPFGVEEPRAHAPHPCAEERPAPVSVTLFSQQSMAPGGDVVGGVVRELEAFSIENSTPMECMMFLSRVKSELKKRGGSGSL